jgi:hypothetical protein
VRDFATIAELDEVVVTLLVVFPAACFAATVRLLAWGLCRAAAEGDRLLNDEG